MGLTESMLALVYALAMGLGIGATATVARRIGEGDPDGAARAAVQAIVLGVSLSLVIGVFGVIYAPRPPRPPRRCAAPRWPWRRCPAPSPACRRR